MSAGKARARVYRDGRVWSWRCTRCPNFGGGSIAWYGAMYGAQLHVEAHVQGFYR